MKPYVVLIGRFQPLHVVHKQLIDYALQQAENVIIVLGSKNSARTIKNPWLVEERETMIRASYSESTQSRLFFTHVDDHFYNDQMWITEVQQKVGEFIPSNKDVGLITSYKDVSSWFLNAFPMWQSFNPRLTRNLNATDIRNVYFQQQPLEVWSKDLPSGSTQFLVNFQNTSTYFELVEDYKFIHHYKQQWSVAPYPPTFVTTDAVVVKSGHILLIKRKRGGLIALPGGFLDQKERLIDGAIRELKEETRIALNTDVLKHHIKKQAVFDHPERSLRGRIITHAFFFDLGVGELPNIKAGDDAAGCFWIPLNDIDQYIPKLFEDHYTIIRHFVG